MTFGLGMKRWGLGLPSLFKDDTKLTLTYLTSRSNWLPNAFKWDFFEKTVKVKVIILT